jgi:hypothetical protein
VLNRLVRSRLACHFDEATEYAVSGIHVGVPCKLLGELTKVPRESESALSALPYSGAIASLGRGPIRNRGILRGSIRRTLGVNLLYLVVIEAAVFGSGRILQFGPVTVKMVLFSLTLIYACWSLLALDRLRSSTAILTASFLSLLCLGITNGFVHNANMQALGEDISPLLSFLILPFFELTIRSKRNLSVIVRIMVCAALLIGLASTAAFVSVWFLNVPFDTLYGWITLNGGEDFVFEGESGRFFYKGIIFIGIAIIFLVFKRSRSSKAAAGFLLLSLLVIGSRGLLSALALSAFVYALIGPMSSVKKIIFASIVIVVSAISLPLLFLSAGDKSESNAVRVNTIGQVVDRVDSLSAIVGHGFGVGVPERPNHMEITYVEIFHKQGMVGLIWWATVLSNLYLRLRRAVRWGNQDLAYPLFLSAAFVAFESATNPFLNNPIGMYPVLISYVGLGLLDSPDGMRLPSEG